MARKRDTPARRRIREALRAFGYEPREILWNGAWVPVDWGSDGGFSVDGFGSFYSAEDFIGWVNLPGHFETFRNDTRYFRDEFDAGDEDGDTEAV